MGYQEQSLIKDLATDFAGRLIRFFEASDAMKTEHEGRIVGYYWAMSQLVVEVDFEPRYPISLPFFHVALTSEWTKMKPHALVGWDEVLSKGLAVKDPKLPHSCDRCHQPALILFRGIECSNPTCPCYKKP